MTSVALEQGEGKVSVTLSNFEADTKLYPKGVPLLSGYGKKMVKNLVRLMYPNSKPIQF